MSHPIRILLADDDRDDRYLFEEVLADIPLTTALATVVNGVALMKYLSETSELPDALFLDLNMPLKTGQECLKEIRADKRYSKLIIIIYSTSYSKEMADSLQQAGANFYITKCGNFEELKRVIHDMLVIVDTMNEYIPDKYPYLQII